MTILSGQKLKKAKYRFWLQKGAKKAIRQDFLIRDFKLYLISLVLLSQNHFYEWMNNMDFIFSLITFQRTFLGCNVFFFNISCGKGVK